ncbi:hypothetical protein MNV49_007853 [Pseudohyphozyma bogoriensis]|nr:hypothetical protein MNV49_007853 [Pseudohyphozyma bogoriensis]
MSDDHDPSAPSAPSPAAPSEQSLASPPDPPTAPASSPAPATDSAPPPSFPPRPLAFPSTQAPAPAPILALRPNSSIPAFLRVLAVLVFATGTLTSACAWFYRSIVYPRLVIALEARTKLHQAQVDAYGGFLTKLRALRDGKGFSLIRGPDPEEQVHDGPEKKKDHSAQDKATRPATPSSGATSSADDIADGEPSPRLPPAPPILTPLTTSLQTLSTTLNSHASTKPLFFDPTSSPPATESLSTSLTKLTDYISSESFASYSNAYRTNMGIPGGGNVRDEAVKNLKSEIRAVKGALLNRRNFAQLAPRAASPTVQTHM